MITKTVVHYVCDGCGKEGKVNQGSPEAQLLKEIRVGEKYLIFCNQECQNAWMRIPAKVSELPKVEVIEEPKKKKK